MSDDLAGMLPPAMETPADSQAEPAEMTDARVPPQEAEAPSEPAQSANATAAPGQPEAALKNGMSDVFGDECAYLMPKRGELREGRIIAVQENSIVIDLGLKREGIVPAEDLQHLGAEFVATLKPDDVVPVYILRPEDEREGILVSIHRARQEQDWIDAQRLQQTGEIWEGVINGYNRGGLIVQFGKIRGFIPASHISGISRRTDAATMQNVLESMVGQTLPLKVMEVDRRNRRLILSERAARREWRTQQREKLINELREGDRVRGVVSNICDFGVFVDVGGTDGLVHISELSWRRTEHPRDVVKIGDEVEACVLRVDRERKRIGLSLRLAAPDPWDSVEQRYELDQLVTGIVTKLTAFGAFAALEDGIEGLVHISELADIPPRSCEEVVSAGMCLPLRVVKIDRPRRRMGLSLRRVSDEERLDWEDARNASAAAREEPLPEAPAEAMEPSPVAVQSEAPAQPPQEIEAATSADATALEAEATAEVPAGISAEPASALPADAPIEVTSQPLANLEDETATTPPEAPETPPEAASRADLIA